MLSRLTFEKNDIESAFPYFSLNEDFSVRKEALLSSFDAYGKEIPFFYIMIGKNVLEQAICLTYFAFPNSRYFISNLYSVLSDKGKCFTALTSARENYPFVKDLIEACDFFADDYWTFNSGLASTKTFEQCLFLRLWLYDMSVTFGRYSSICSKLENYVQLEGDKFRNALFQDCETQKLLLRETF